MTATPIRLEDALRLQGYAIVEAVVAPITITVVGDDAGTIIVPEAVRSSLVWQEPGTPPLGADLYLGNLPVFDDAYRPVLVSHIIDRYRTRRLGYSTPDEWMLAFRRWGNLNMPYWNRMYQSLAVPLPLDDSDSSVVTGRTEHELTVGSDFPQSLISASTDYASAASDRRQADNVNVASTGRSQSIMELLAKQRDAFMNVDAQLLDQMDSLFLGILDQAEADPWGPLGAPPLGLHGLDWREW